MLTPPLPFCAAFGAVAGLLLFQHFHSRFRATRDTAATAGLGAAFVGLYPSNVCFTTGIYL